MVKEVDCEFMVVFLLNIFFRRKMKEFGNFKLEKLLELNINRLKTYYAVRVSFDA